MSDTILQLIAPFAAAILVTFFTWRLNCTLSRGAPITPFSQKLLSHGFLFMLGAGLLIAWNDQLAALLRFPGREVWRPLSFGWAVLLLYDATRRLHREGEAHDAGRGSDPLAVMETDESPRPAKTDWNNIGITAMRFVLFFAIVGAIGMRQIAGYVMVAALAVTLWVLERKSGRAAVPPERSS